MASTETFDSFVSLVRDWYGTRDFIPLHEPRFGDLEKRFVSDTIESTFVSSVGKYVDEFEKVVCDYTGAQFAVATVNGTAALHAALILCDVNPGDLVVTQALTFSATCSAIRYCNADPAFVDIDPVTLGMAPSSLQAFFEDQCDVIAGKCVHKSTGKTVKACVPMHTFGHPAEIEAIADICVNFGVLLVEDAAEGLGSFRNGRHVGTHGQINTLSFNGNKIVTTGGGGMLLFNDESLAVRAKHLTTTAKKPHRWHYDHDMLGYNYRLPNLNAALGCAQMQSLDIFLESKRSLSARYTAWCDQNGVDWIENPENCISNNWLMAIRLKNVEERDRFLEYSNDKGVMTRPAWKPMHTLSLYAGAARTDLSRTESLFERVVNIPSSALPLANQ